MPNVPGHPGPCLPLVLGPGARKVTDRPGLDSHNVGRAFWDKNADDLPGAIKLIHLGREVSQVVADSPPCKVILSSSRHGMIAALRAACQRRRRCRPERLLADETRFRNHYASVGMMWHPPETVRIASPVWPGGHISRATLPHAVSRGMAPPPAECLPVRRARRALCLSPGRGAAALRLAAL